MHGVSDGPKKTLVARGEFVADLVNSRNQIQGLSIAEHEIRFFLPPDQYYNQEMADWSKMLGLTMVNFSPSTPDRTTEAESNFASSEVIFDSLIAKDQEDPNGLNGFLLLLHIGSGPARADKFHVRFGELLDYLAGKGYQLVRVDELLERR